MIRQIAVQGSRRWPITLLVQLAGAALDRWIWSIWCSSSSSLSLAVLKQRPLLPIKRQGRRGTLSSLLSLSRLERRKLLKCTFARRLPGAGSAPTEPSCNLGYLLSAICIATESIRSTKPCERVRRCHSGLNLTMETPQKFLSGAAILTIGQSNGIFASSSAQIYLTALVSREHHERT